MGPCLPQVTSTPQSTTGPRLAGGTLPPFFFAGPEANRQESAGYSTVGISVLPCELPSTEPATEKIALPSETLICVR